MKQYCRYCSYCSYGDVVYCSKYDETMKEEKAKRINNCKEFDFNEIDVFNLEHTYKERKTKEIEQLKLFD